MGLSGMGRLSRFRRPTPLTLTTADPPTTNVYRTLPPAQHRPSIPLAPAERPALQLQKAKPSENPSLAIVETARSAFEKQEYALALKELERAVIFCSSTQDQKTCAALDHTLALTRGRIFERQNRWAEALLEYQRAAAGANDKERVLAGAAMARLAPRFGKVVIRSSKNGRCQQEIQWLEPGQLHQVKLGGARRELQVAAGQTLELGTCP
jgi:hypothetical protein